MKKGSAYLPTKFIPVFPVLPVVGLYLAVLTRRVIPDSGHLISEIERLRLHLRACSELAPELS